MSKLPVVKARGFAPVFLRMAEPILPTPAPDAPPVPPPSRAKIFFRRLGSSVALWTFGAARALLRQHSPVRHHVPHRDARDCRARARRVLPIGHESRLRLFPQVGPGRRTDVNGGDVSLCAGRHEGKSSAGQGERFRGRHPGSLRARHLLPAIPFHARRLGPAAHLHDAVRADVRAVAVELHPEAALFSRHHRAGRLAHRHRWKFLRALLHSRDEVQRPRRVLRRLAHRQTQNDSAHQPRQNVGRFRRRDCRFDVGERGCSPASVASGGSTGEIKNPGLFGGFFGNGGCGGSSSNHFQKGGGNNNRGFFPGGRRELEEAAFIPPLYFYW